MADMKQNYENWKQKTESAINEWACEYERTLSSEQKSVLREKITIGLICYALAVYHKAYRPCTKREAEQNLSLALMRVTDTVSEDVNQVDSKHQQQDFSVTLMNLINEILPRYDSKRGNFINLFNFKYSLYNKEQKHKETLVNMTGGTKISAEDIRRISKYRRALEHLLPEEKLFELTKGKKLEELSDQELRLLRERVQRSETEANYSTESDLDLLSTLALVNVKSTSVDVGEDGYSTVEDLIPDVENPATEEVGISKIIRAENRKLLVDIYQRLLDKSSKISRPYFKCFLIQDVWEGDNGLNWMLGDLESLCDMDFYKLMKKEQGKKEKIYDVEIAEYLHVTKGAVSKQHAKYEIMRRNVANELKKKMSE